MFEGGSSALQLAIFFGLTVLIALLTYWKVHGAGAGNKAERNSEKELFLAGGGLSWMFVAGSITLTNLSTEQLVGMNGNQMFLVAWWELAGFVGLLMLAFIFVPIYYRNQCTTVTELLEKRYEGGSIRTVISALFLLGNILIYLPAALYSGSVFLKSMFGVDWSLLWFAIPMAVIAAAYTITGGLRAVAVMDTYSGIGVLSIALLVVILALSRIGFDLSGIPTNRISMVGNASSPIPFHTLFTGMIFIQIFYWSTNQNITQKAMTAPNVREAQKGVMAAAVIRILVIPAIVVVPGVAAFKIFGELKEQNLVYGRIVAEVLPPWLSGAFAALMAAAVIAHTAAILNSSVALYSVDLHNKFVARTKNPWRLAAWTAGILTVTSIALVPLFNSDESIIGRLQELNGILSMPILSAFVAGLLFRNVDARAAVVGLLYGVATYSFHNFVLYKPDVVYTGQTFYEHIGLPWLHYIDVMVLVLMTSVMVALAVNRFIFGNRATFVWSEKGRALRAAQA